MSESAGVRAVAAEVVDGLDRLGIDPLRIERRPHHLDERGVRALRGGTSAEDHGVAGS